MKTLHDDKQTQQMLNLQQSMADRDNEMIRQRQAEMLKKFQQKEAEKKSADAENENGKK